MQRQAAPAVVPRLRPTLGAAEALIARPLLQKTAMRIDHLALWTNDLERCKHFYVSYFGATAGAEYTNATKGFRSYFLSFAEGARIEVMTTTKLQPLSIESGAQRMGLTHFAIALGAEHLVDELTQRLKRDGYPVLDGPRWTGDGYYESVVLDPDGNRIEITA
jgi:lactoylglutathione lyase